MEEYNKLSCVLKQTGILTDQTSFSDGYIYLYNNELILEWEGEFEPFHDTRSHFNLIIEEDWEDEYYCFELTLNAEEGDFSIDEFTMEKDKEYNECLQWFKTKELKDKLNTISENKTISPKIKV